VLARYSPPLRSHKRRGVLALFRSFRPLVGVLFPPVLLAVSVVRLL
jgi:hypothetical protein